MGNIIYDSLYKRQNAQFEKINELSKAFAANYCGNTIIRDSIFSVVPNYAKKRGLSFELFRYPFMDNELWALTFIKKGTVFLCINSGLPACKQIFAMAHELYHIHCYAEDINADTITDGSLLDSSIFDEKAVSQEDLEANAFAGLLLMPDISMIEQMKIFGISKERLNVDDILILMDIFSLPYKAVVLRLLENRVIKETNAKELLDKNSVDIADRIEITGKAKKWQQNSNYLIYYGTLLENMTFNAEHDLLINTREASDKAYLKEIEKEFHGKNREKL